MDFETELSTSYNVGERLKFYTSAVVNGIYKCKRVGPDVASRQTTATEKCWWYGFLLIFLLTVTIVFCWSVFSNDYNDLNWFIYDNAEIWFGWGLLILCVLSLLLFYSFLILCSGIALIANGESRHLHICHKVFIIVTLFVCIGGYVVIDRLWNEEFYSAVIALRMVGPWLQIALLFIVVALSWLIFSEIMKVNHFIAWTLANIGMLVLFFLVFFMPLFITSPCIGTDLDSVAKPLIISHRLGDVKHAPENTLLAFDEGHKKCSSFAAETDVSISFDGVPFLMHDTKNIQRTTNVAAVFPDKANQRAEFFTWAELQQLDAGSWFLEKDPFHTANSLSNNMKNKIKTQKIPALSEVGRLLGNYSILFDLFQPQYPHPYRYNFTEVALAAVLSSGVLPENQVLWLPGYNRDQIQQQAPGLRMVATDNPIEYFHQANISIANLGYLEQTPESIAKYVQNNISVIQYRIEVPWLFSYAWCQRTAMVTTDSCERLSNMQSPIWTLTKEGYDAVWVCTGLIALVCLIVIFFVQYHRSGSKHLNCFLYHVMDRSESVIPAVECISLEL